MRKVILDTNIILDVILIRKPFYNDASKILLAIDNKQIRAFITANSVTDIYYILRKSIGKENARIKLKNILNVIGILDTDSVIIFDALYSGWDDFEDAVQGYSALYNDIDCIITRNLQDYKHIENIEIASANEFANNYLQT